MPSPNKLIAYLATATLFTAAYADDWEHFQYTSDGGAIYETSIIEESGFFSKEFDIWLRATFEINESKCGSAPTPASLNYSTDSSEIIRRALASQETQRNYSLCMKNLEKKNKVAIYKVNFSCEKKRINANPTTVTNFRGEPVPPELYIKDHPGSIGYEIIKHYCK